jgi:hypothetical protein
VVRRVADCAEAEGVCVVTRDLAEETHAADLVVVGGGMSGVGAALAAARRGLQVALVHDRPFAGGNASKEHRVHISGAEGSALNHCFRETGLLEELRLENLWRNPDGNAEDWQICLNDFLFREQNLRPFFNTTCCGVQVDDERIQSVTGIQLGTEKRLTFTAPLFCDCTGDGTVGYLAGCGFRVGREGRAVFGERFTPEDDDPETMGASIMVFIRDTGKPVHFQRPAWVPKLEESHFAHRRLPARPTGLWSWWIEFGGRLDTIADNEQVHRELLKIAYGIWDFIKNDPSRKEDNLTLGLEWLGYHPAKRESRRIEGLCWLTGEDLLGQTAFEDAIGMGGWTMDDHPSGGFHDTLLAPARFVIVPGLYNFPLQCLIAKGVDNLLLAGRCASCSHQALASTRVMATCLQMGEAAGAVAAACAQRHCVPAELYETEGAIHQIQQDLLADDHAIVGVAAADERDLARAAAVTASSHAAVELTDPDAAVPLETDRMVMLPVVGALRRVSVLLDVAADTQLAYEWWHADGKGNAFPTTRLAARSIELAAGRGQWVEFAVTAADFRGWYFLVLFENAEIAWRVTSHRRPGVYSFVPDPDEDLPHRNPVCPWRRTDLRGWAKKTPCIRTDPPQPAYEPTNVINGFGRAFRLPNLWLSDQTDFHAPEWIELTWDAPEQIERIQLAWDSDLDRDIRNVGTPMPARVIETLARDYRILLRRPGGGLSPAIEVTDNHQRLVHHELTPTRVNAIRIEALRTWGAPAVGLYEVRVY